MDIVFVVLIGLCFGSFINAWVWRVRKKRDIVRERSECTHCHHVLAWYDLIPVMSYMVLRGRCRYCRKPIDDSPWTEVVCAGVMTLSYVTWPFGFGDPAAVTLFVVWLCLLVVLIALAVYDIRWMLLPDVMVFPLIGIACITGIIRFRFVEGLGVGEVAVQMLGGVVIAAGLYGALYTASRGRWVGLGDVKLNIALGMMAGWQGALAIIMIANLLGVIWIIPGMVAGKIRRDSHIPFGPFLIAAFLITFLWGHIIVDWYMNMLVVS